MNQLLIKTIKYFSLPFLILFIHWISIYIYYKFCIPSEIYSILTSMIYTGSPMCSALISLSDKTSSLYISTWALIGVYIVSGMKDFSKWLTNQSINQ